MAPKKKKTENAQVNPTDPSQDPGPAKGNVKAKPSVSKLGQLASLVDKAFKSKAGKVDLDQSVRTKPHPHIPTGSIIIDWLIGGQPNQLGVPPCPGLPKGRLCNIYGMESSGKTTLALTTAATTIANGGRVCFIDWEHAIDLRYVAALGIPQDEDKFYLSQPTDLETGMGIIWVMARGGVDLIVIDSVGAGVPKELMEKDVGEVGDIGRLGLLSQKWGVFLPKLKEAIAKSGTSVIGISQLRDKISSGGYGPTKHAQGGNSWKFYSELRMMLRSIKRERGKVYDALGNKNKDAIIGNVVRAQVEKCKVAPTQGSEADFFIRFGEGIDDVRSIIEIAKAHGIVKQGGPWFSWDRGQKDPIKSQGLDNFRQDILSTSGAWEDLYRSTLKCMSESVKRNIIISGDDEEIDLDDIAFLTGGKSDDNQD